MAADHAVDKVAHAAADRATDVSFRLRFQKARERTPETRADFADATVALVNDVWTATAAGAGQVEPTPTGRKFYEALTDLIVKEARGGRGRRTREGHR